MVLAAVSLAVGGVALGLALARGKEVGTAEQVAMHIDSAHPDGMSKSDSRMFKHEDGKREADRYEQGERKHDADRYERGKHVHGRYHDWWHSRRVIVVPRIEVSPRSIFRGDSPIMRRLERLMPERRVARPGGMVIAVGEVTDIRDGAIEMFTVLGNEVTIDISELGEDIAPAMGGSAIVIAERNGDGYVARSMELLDVRLSEMLEGMRTPARSRS